MKSLPRAHDVNTAIMLQLRARAKMWSWKTTFQPTTKKEAELKLRAAIRKQELARIKYQAL